MDKSLHKYEEIVLNSDNVLSVLIVQGSSKKSLSLDGADYLYLVIQNQPDPRWEIKQLLLDEIQILEHRVSQWQMEEWAIHGMDERLTRWLTEGRMIRDENNYLRDLVGKIQRRDQLRMVRICKEYSHMLKHFYHAKESLQNQYIADSYQAVMNALLSWARLVTWEARKQPQEMIWRQVKSIEPSLFKLYEELVDSPEPLQKRIELLMLPIEFQVMSKMKSCTAFLLDILQDQHEPMSIAQLKNHKYLMKVDLDLPFLLDRMVSRSLLKEVVIQHQDTSSLPEKRYILVS